MTLTFQGGSVGRLKDLGEMHKLVSTNSSPESKRAFASAADRLVLLHNLKLRQVSWSKLNVMLPSSRLCKPCTCSRELLAPAKILAGLGEQYNIELLWLHTTDTVHSLVTFKVIFQPRF